MNNVLVLKNQRRQLDYELMEERYRLESIPKRKAFTKSKIFFILLFAIPITALVIACVVTIISICMKGLDNRTKIQGVSVLFCAIGTLAGSAMGFVLWRNFFKEASFLFGGSNKFETNGAMNYRDEEKISTDKIKGLIDAIEEIDRKISETVSTTDVIDDSYEDDFFTYAYGTWGDGKSEIINKMKSDAFEAEEERLNKKIEDEKQNLLRAARAKNMINNNFQKVKDMFMFYFIGIMVCIFINLKNIDGNKGEFNTQIVFAIYGIVGLIFIILINKDNIMSYLVENKYSRYKAYAEEKGIITTSMQKANILKNIDDCQHRLEYVQRALEYKSKYLS